MATAGNPLAQLVVRFVAESAPFVAGLQAAQDQTDKFASSFSNFAKTIAGATPFAAIAAGSFHAAEEFSSAESTIARLSGATGQALSELQGSFRSLFTQTTQSASELAEGFGRIQRESGATGAQLEALVLTNSNLARVTGQSLVPTIDQTQAALKAFGIAASEQPAKLDVLFSLSQKTGTSIGVLSSGLQSAAPVLKTIGLSFDQSAALLANFAEKGISTDKVVSALNVGLVKLAQDGVKQPEIALRNFVDRVTQAATPMDALNIVAETFGKRSGLFLADAARVGALNIANLTEVTRNSAGSINSTAEKTETLSEALTKLGHSADVALAPLGTPLVKALEESVKAAIPLLNAVGQLSGKIAEANPHLLELTASIIAAGPVLILAAKYFKELAAATAFLKVPQVLTFSVAGVPILPFAAAAAATALQIDNLQKKWEDFDETLRTKQILDALNQGKTIEGLKQLGFSIDDIKKAVGGLDGTKQTFSDMGLGIKIVTDEVSKLKTAAPPTAEEIKKAFADLGLKNISKEIADVQNAFNIIARSGTLSANQLRGAFETAQLKIIELRASVASAPLKALGIDTTELAVAQKALELITQDVLAGRASMDQLAQAQENYTAKVLASEAGLNRIEIALSKAGTASQTLNFDQLVQEVTVAQQIVNSLGPAFDPVKEDVDAAAKLVDDLAENLQKAGPSAAPLREALREVQLQMSAIRNTTLFSSESFDFANTKLDQFVQRLEAVQTASLSVEATLHDLGQKSPQEVADGIGQVQDAISKMQAAVAVGVPGAAQAVLGLFSLLTKLEVQALNPEPFHRFGIASSKELELLQQDAERDFEAIRSTVGITSRDIAIAWVAMIQELERKGQQFNAQTEIDVLDTERKISRTAKAAVEAINQQVTAGLKDISNGIAQVIVEGKSWEDTFRAIGARIAEDIIAGLINRELQSTIKIIDSLIVKFGQWLGIISDTGAAAAKAAKDVASIATPPISTTSGIPGIGGSSGGGGAAGGAAGSSGGALGIVNAVTGGITAVASVLQLFGIGQGGEKDRLNIIANSTSYLAWVFSAGGGHDALLNIQNALNVLTDAFVNWFRDDMQQLIDLATYIKALQGGGASSTTVSSGPTQTFTGPVTFNFNIEGGGQPDQIADAIARKLKLRSPVFA